MSVHTLMLTSRTILIFLGSEPIWQLKKYMIFHRALLLDPSRALLKTDLWDCYPTEPERQVTRFVAAVFLSPYKIVRLGIV